MLASSCFTSSSLQGSSSSVDVMVFVMFFLRERGNILYINGSYLWAHLSKSWLSWAEWGYASAYLFCMWMGGCSVKIWHKACWWKTLYTMPACFRLEKCHFTNYLKINFCAGVNGQRHDSLSLRMYRKVNGWMMCRPARNPVKSRQLVISIKSFIKIN